MHSAFLLAPPTYRVKRTTRVIVDDFREQARSYSGSELEIFFATVSRFPHLA